MKKTKENCPICDESYLYEESIKIDFKYKGKTFSINNCPALVCKACGESFLDEPKFKPIEKEIKEQHRLIDELLSSEEIRNIRLLLGLSQKELSGLLGGGEKGFARYENGSINQSKAMDNLLRILKRFPILLSYLNERDQKNKKCKSQWLLTPNCNTSGNMPIRHAEIENLDDLHHFTIPFQFERNLDDEENRYPV